MKTNPNKRRASKSTENNQKARQGPREVIDITISETIHVPLKNDKKDKTTAQ